MGGHRWQDFGVVMGPFLKHSCLTLMMVHYWEKCLLVQCHLSMSLSQMQRHCQMNTRKGTDDTSDRKASPNIQARFMCRERSGHHEGMKGKSFRRQALLPSQQPLIQPKETQGYPKVINISQCHLQVQKQLSLSYQVIYYLLSSQTLDFNSTDCLNHNNRSKIQLHICESNHCGNNF